MSKIILIISLLNLLNILIKTHECIHWKIIKDLPKIKVLKRKKKKPTKIQKIIKKTPKTVQTSKILKKVDKKKLLKGRNLQEKTKDRKPLKNPELPKNPESPKNPNSSQNRDEQAYRPLRFHLDYSSTLIKDIKTYIYIKNTILTEVIRKLSSLIKVKGPYNIPLFSETSCDPILNVPETYNKIETDTDLILFIKIIYEETGYLAYATPCAMSDFDNRPNVGVVSINEKYLSLNSGNIKKMQNTITHEIFHILAISPVLYEFFLQDKNKILTTSEKNGKTITKLTTPKLLKHAKTHFNCKSITGVNLENEGPKASAGSHFEKLHLGNELMTSQMTGNPSLSKFTLFLLEDSGWYKIDFSKAEKFFWGKKKGCEFLENCGSNEIEFCYKEDQMGCSEDFEFKTVCAFSNFSDDCLYKEFVRGFKCSKEFNFVKSTLYEENGPGSRCFNVVYNDVEKSGCFKAFCQQGKISIEIDGFFVFCEKGQEKTLFDDFVVLCPDFEKFCGFEEKKCEMDCNGNGICLENKECKCDYFFGGVYCEERRQCHDGDEEICEILYGLEGLGSFLKAYGSFWCFFLGLLMIF